MSHNLSHILLVDDSVDDADLATHALRRGKLTNQIDVVRDGEEALDYLFCRRDYSGRSFENPPLLVLLDLKLPKLNGLEVLAEVKADARTKTIPVVIMTSSNEDRDINVAFRLGANSYVQKPVNFDQFQDTVKTVGIYWLVVNRHPVPGEINAI